MNTTKKVTKTAISKVPYNKLVVRLNELLYPDLSFNALYKYYKKELVEFIYEFQDELDIDYILTGGEN